MAVASMTGYAVASGATPLGTVTLECRSVNSRFLDLTLRLTEDVRFADPLIRETLQKRLARGKVEVRGSLTPDENAAPASINRAVLERIISLQNTVLGVVPNARELSVADLMEMPGVMVTERPDQDAVTAAVQTILDSALDAFTASREREGEALAKVLLGNCDQIEEIVKSLSVKMPDILAHIQIKLTERLESALSDALTEKSTLTREEVADRIRQEVTLYAIRMDVEEEMNRLLTHVAEVRRILQKGGAVGRRLDFVVQEMNREANTLGSKAAAVDMTNASLALKVVIEQMREQIQNLE
ncbi:MAG: YicC/YloC family endoribonuclease [Sutterella sp.]|nr:YicC/YloC family endoribonuclease [Sutterella sp.]